MVYLYTTKVNGQKYKFIYNTRKPFEMTVFVNGKKRVFECPIPFSSSENFKKYHDDFFNNKDCVKNFLNDVAIMGGVLKC